MYKLRQEHDISRELGVEEEGSQIHNIVSQGGCRVLHYRTSTHLIEAITYNKNINSSKITSQGNMFSKVKSVKDW
jgi:hypothetical protein